MSFLFSNFHMIKYPSPIRNGISPNDHAPPSSLMAPSHIIKPRPTMVHTTPRRTSERRRIPRVAGASNSAGTGWPFSTIIRIVRCRIRVAIIENIPIITTIATGAPNMDKNTIATIGIATKLRICSRSASSSLSFPSMMMPCL